jgi:hypothetical protein
MITCELMGGLGNQLFQIFNVISYSIKHDIPFTFQYSETLKIGRERPTYWNNLLKSIKLYTSNDYKPQRSYNEPSFRFSEIPKMDSCCFYGYFQSYKYFEENKKTIIGLCELDRQRRPSQKAISMHFRLGDYKQAQGYHPLLKASYYENAMRYLEDKIGNDYTVMVFCEWEDIDTVRKTIDVLNIKYPVVFIDDSIPDWEQMLMMSSCEVNIIANSTFSWWGAYFNDSPDRIVLYPSTWFGHNLTHDISDLFPDDWRKIDS